MTKLANLLILILLCGCQALSQKEVSDPLVLNRQAQEALEYGEFFRARRLAERALKEEPANEESRKLMAMILDQEIARQKEAFDSQEPDDLEPGEKELQVKTWLERSREMFRSKQYEEALVAAEKVFAYDAENIQASELIDEIRKEVYAEGKQDSVFLKKMYQDESGERILRYREKAKRQIETQQWGAAKLTVEKILLLAPRDREGLKLYEQIQKREALNP